MNQASQHGATAGFDSTRFVGAKRSSGVWQRIVSQMPPHARYCEPFLGTGAIAKKKRQAEENIVNDKDGHAIMAFRRWVADNGGGRSYTFRCGDAIELLEAILRANDNTPMLIYCDPPYLPSARNAKGRRYYRHEMDERDHIRLLNVLIELPLVNMVMLSGYRSELYDHMLNEWRRVDIPTTRRSGNRAVECVWMNFPEPTFLHDYRWLGEGWRERERINRRIRRWRHKLDAMPLLERRALLADIRERFPQ